MFYIVVDSRGNFCSDVENRLAICDDLEMTVQCFTAMDRIVSVLGQNRVDAVFIADNVVESADFFMPQAPLYAYTTKPDGAAVIMQKGLVNVGQIGSAKILVEFLSSFQPVPQAAPMPQTPPQTAPTQPQYSQPPIGQTAPVQQTAPVRQGQYAASPQAQTGQYSVPIQAQSGQYAVPPQSQYIQPPIPGQSQTSMSQMPPMQPQYPQMPPMQTDTVRQGQYAIPPQAQPMPVQAEPVGYQPQMPVQGAFGALTDDSPIQISDGRKTTVAAFYSAKGGVGKTTLSSEVAAYLSLTCRKRGNLKVCIVDYNIDFGDVLTTLGFAPDGVNMCVWASEIQERIGSGQNPEEIVYNASEIVGNFLQRKSFNQNSEIYALLAPPSHEDSMNLSEEALEIMLKNIVNCGEFDFVICDTGNNTRDSSIIALDFADYIFMILTQDVTAINCCDSFLSTMRKMQFDESRIRLIINNITSAKETQISVSEIEQFVKFPCVARIKRSPDVIKANNKSTPLVFKANHEFTKELRKIILFLIHDGEIPVEAKKGLFSFVSKKNGGAEEKKPMFGRGR